MIRGWKSAAALVALVVAAASPASAQIGFGIAGGPSFGLGDSFSAYDMGYHVQGSASLSIPLIPIGVRVDGLYNRFPSDGATFQTLGGSVNGILSIPSVGITPYVIGGVGMYKNKVDFENNDDTSTTDFGVNIGAGVKLGLPGLGVYVEGRLHNIFGDEGAGSLRFAPLSIGLKF
jgi:hypothetical protein